MLNMWLFTIENCLPYRLEINFLRNPYRMKAVFALRLWMVPHRVSEQIGSGSVPYPWLGALYTLVWIRRYTVKLNRVWSCVWTTWFNWGWSSRKQTAGLCVSSQGWACQLETWKASVLKHPDILHLIFCRQSYCYYFSHWHLNFQSQLELFVG